MKRTQRNKILSAGVALWCVACLAQGAEPSPNTATAKPNDPEVKGEEVAITSAAPNVPPPIARRSPAKVVVQLEVIETTKRLADGVEYVFWTFGGDVPGRFIRI